MSTARVLVVDDTLVVRRLIGDRLRRTGYQVTEAADGREALAAFSRQPAHVVISDLSMPHLHGLDLLAELRGFASPPEVILLTATHARDVGAAVQALRLGAHDYIAKDENADEAVVLAVQRAFEKWRLREENARLVRELENRTLTDGLTRVGNRRAFDAAMLVEISRARRSGAPFSLLMLDLDHFKRVNDVHGHLAGDAVLIAFAARLQALVRAADQVFRYGGEEFSVLLPDTSVPGAIELAGRLLTSLAEEPLRADHLAIPLTCSAGAAMLRAEDGYSPIQLLRRADSALYAAKRGGRNRVVCEGGSPERASTVAAVAQC